MDNVKGSNYFKFSALNVPMCLHAIKIMEDIKFVHVCA